MKWIYQGFNLKRILKGVSRSFYLSLVLLPRRIRLPMGLAFLCCKAADTIADTELIPKPERLKLLDAYREMFATQADGFAFDVVETISSSTGGSPSEKELLKALPALMEALSKLPSQDWVLIQELVLELTQGMQMDLKLKRLKTEGELEQYIYYVAGCVGRFWTKMIKNHYAFAKHFDEEVESLGEQLGKGLQLVNILRDLAQDLKQGRCYIPETLLTERGLTSATLLDPAQFEKVRPLLLALLEKAKTYLSAYEKYCSFFPRWALRLKVVVRLPARLGFKTLKLLENSKEWLNPDCVHKVSRRQVYQILLDSIFS